jgi:hypothetical protein
MATLHQKKGTELQEHGGHLECNACGLVQSLGDVSTYLKSGWPKHCGYTMTWITKRQES